MDVKVARTVLGWGVFVDNVLEEIYDDQEKANELAAWILETQKEGEV
jgi:hypothetical protein